jgi:uncharacterized membrane protein
MILLDIGAGVGFAAAGLFLAVFVGVAYVVFRLLKKSVKMAFRLAIVAVILVIAIAGSVSFWWLGSSKPARTEKPRQTQPK